MERLVVSPEGGIQDEGYLEQILALLDGAPVLTFANTRENGPDIRCVVSVRKFLDPRLLMERWALVVDGDSYVVWDYVNWREARAAYRGLLARCAIDGTVWDVTSDGWQA